MIIFNVTNRQRSKTRNDHEYLTLRIHFDIILHILNRFLLIC